MSDLKILLFDIETSIPKVYTYGLYDQNISIANVIEHPRMIAFTAKWLGQKKVFAFSEFHQSRREMLEAIHTLMDEADVVVGWNSRGFDVKWVNSEFLVEKMTPPSPFKQIDLMQETKRNARFLSNKLDYISERLLGDNKIDYNMARMWIKVDNPNTSDKDRKREWDAMIRYAKKDTVLLEPLFNELRPWLKMPAAISDDPDSCHNCGGTELQRRGWALTMYGKYPRFVCSGEKGCGKWLRGTTRTQVTTHRSL